MTIIVAWLWQGLAIALLTAVVLRRMRAVNAATRHAIWWFALVAVLLLPLVQSVAVPPLALSPQLTDDPRIASALVVVPAISSWVIFCAVAIWFGTVLAGGLRIAAGLRRLVRLKEQSRPFDPVRETRLTMWTSVGQSGRPELRVADTACGARALGLGRPMILVSNRLSKALDDDALDQIVMHEYAHLARFDDWSRLAQAIVTAMAGLHPAVRFISRQIDLEREAACDDRVVSRTGAARRYAACLADAAAVSVGAFDTAVIPSAIGSPSTLRVRVGRLLESQRDRAPRPAPAVSVAGVILFAGIVIASKEMRPVVTFLESPSAVENLASRALSTANQGSVRLPPSREASAFAGADAEPVDPAHPEPVEGSRPQPTALVPIASVAVKPADSVPAAISQIVQAQPVVDTPPPLEAHRFEHAYGAPATPVSPVTSSSGTPWNRTADAGIAFGDSAKRAGVAIGGWFTRTGKTIARTF